MGMVTLKSIHKNPKKLLTPHVQNYTELGMTNHVINYKEAWFSKIKYSFGIEITCLCDVFLHKFMRFYYGTF